MSTFAKRIVASIAIIGVVGVAVLIVDDVRDGAERDRLRSQLVLLQQVCDAYANRTGTYPGDRMTALQIAESAIPYGQRQDLLEHGLAVLPPGDGMVSNMWCVAGNGDLVFAPISRHAGK